jgi:hypothetical protein
MLLSLNQSLNRGVALKTYLIAHKEYFADEDHGRHVVNRLHEGIVGENCALNHREEHFDQSLEWPPLLIDFKFEGPYD